MSSSAAGPAAQRHQRKHLEYDVGREQRGHLARPVVGRRDLDHVESDEGQVHKGAQVAERLEAGGPADLGRARAGTEGSVDEVDVQREKGRPVSHPGPDAIGEISHRHSLEIDPGDRLHAQLGRDGLVVLAVERAADAGLQHARGVHHFLLQGAPEHRAVRVGVAVVAVPQIRVRVEVHKAERPVHRRQGPQLGQGDRMIAPHADRHRRRLSEGTDELLDPAQGVLDVARRRRAVAVVDRGQLSEYLHPLHRVVGANHSRGRPNALGPESGSRAKRCAAVPGHAEDGCIDALEVLHVGQPGVGAWARETRRLQGIPRLVHHSSSRTACAALAYSSARSRSR